MADLHGNKVKLFALNSNPELAKEIASYEMALDKSKKAFSIVNDLEEKQKQLENMT